MAGFMGRNSYNYRRYRQQRRLADMAGMSRSQRILAQLIFLSFIVLGIVIWYMYILH